MGLLGVVPHMTPAALRIRWRAHATRSYRCQSADRANRPILRRNEEAANSLQEGQLNVTAKFEAGLNEVKNSVSTNHALRNLRLVESSVALEA